MKITQKQYIFNYIGKDMVQFRLCVDLFGDQRERVYRLYCPYVTGYWKFRSAAGMAKSLLETVSAMRRQEAPENIFSTQRGIKDIILKCSPHSWEKNMLHTKRGSFYSFYIGFWLKDDTDQNGFITLIDNESEVRHVSINKSFATEAALCEIIREIEKIYTTSHSVRERHNLFFRYKVQKKKGIEK